MSARGISPGLREPDLMNTDERRLPTPKYEIFSASAGSIL
jgi:hypothetical protein